MEQYSAIKRKAFESLLMRWMNLEPIIQSEVGKKEKNRYCILMHIYGIQKDSTDEPSFRAPMETGTLLGEEEEGKMNGKGIVEAYTLPYVKQIASGNLLYDSGNSNWPL